VPENFAVSTLVHNKKGCDTMGERMGRIDTDFFGFILKIRAKKGMFHLAGEVVYTFSVKKDNKRLFQSCRD
jgi:hypothetical protein